MRIGILLLTLVFMLLSCGVTQEQFDSRMGRVDDKIDRLASTLEADRQQNQLILNRMRDSVRFYRELVSTLERENILLGNDSVDFTGLAQLIRNQQEMEKANAQLRQEKNTRDDSLGLQRAFVSALLNSPSPTYSAAIPLFNNTFHAYIVNLDQIDLRLFWKDC